MTRMTQAQQGIEGSFLLIYIYVSYLYIYILIGANSHLVGVTKNVS